MDRLLVERAQRGDEAAFAELVEQTGDRMYAIARHLLRDSERADDAVQHAMIEIWRRLPTLRYPDRYASWAYRILIRSAYAEADRRRRWLLFDLGRQPVAISPDHAGSVADRDEMDRALAQLSTQHRAVVILKHYAGLSNPEISEALDVPEGTVRSRLHYAMQALRAALEAESRPAIAPAEP